jgi:hypothetical protein
VYIKDSGYFEVLLVDADKWDFVRSVRGGCLECRDLPVVWALFPLEFKDVIDAILHEGSQQHRLMKLRFDSVTKTGVSVDNEEAGKL